MTSSKFQIGDKVYSSFYDRTGVVIAHLNPVMGIPTVRIEYVTKPLDTLQPVTLFCGLMEDGIVLAGDAK